MGWGPARLRKSGRSQRPPERLTRWAAGGYGHVLGAAMTGAMARVRKATWLSGIRRRDGRGQTNVARWGQTRAQARRLIQFLWPSKTRSVQSLELPIPSLPRSKAGRVGVGWVAQAHSSSFLSMTHRASGRFQFSHMTDGETDRKTGSRASFPFHSILYLPPAGPCGACGIPPFLRALGLRFELALASGLLAHVTGPEA